MTDPVAGNDAASGSGSAGGHGSAGGNGFRELPCYMCGATDEELKFDDGPYRVVECRRCSHVYVNPRLSSERLHEMYQEEYWESDRAKDFGYTEYLREKPLYERTYRRRAEIIERYKRGFTGRVLDVGCAAGFFLSVMQERGWETTGVEISGKMVEYAREEGGLPDVRHGDLLSVDLPEQTFDVITFWDVIEHLEDPVAHLARARDLLHRNGLLLIETQNVRAGFARLLGKKWQHYKHEEHLYHFHPATLAALVEQAGLEIVENTPRHGGKYVSFGFIQERVGKLHPVMSVLASPLKLVGGKTLYLNFRDEMVALCKKR